MDDDFLFEDSKPKPRRGRPRGSKNRDAVSIETEKRVEQLFKRMQPFMTREQKAYADDIQNGRADVDPLKELELIIRQATFVFSEAADEHWRARRISKELSEMINAIRMSLKDFEEIKRLREEKAEQQNTVEALDLEDKELERQKLEKLLGRFNEKHESE